MVKGVAIRHYAMVHAFGIYAAESIIQIQRVIERA